MATTNKKKKPHVLFVPHAAQGHVSPMLKLGRKLTDHGIVVTFVNFDFVHCKIVPSGEENNREKKYCNSSNMEQQSHDGIRFVSVPRGLESGLDYSGDLTPMDVTESVENVLPVHLKNLLLIEPDFSWVVADAFLAEVFMVAKEMGIKTAALWTASMENLGLTLRIPELIEAGTIDENGWALNKDLPISLTEEIPAWKSNELPWSIDSEELQIFIFKHYYTKPAQYLSLFDTLLVNSSYELEASAFQLFLDILPIGPLVTNSTSGSFWSQDPTCLAWLDEHPPRSVIYVAFGSLVVISPQQFQELALGLEMTGKPFLWVIRENSVQRTGAESDPKLPDGFVERVSGRGKMVKWANQEEVLSHPSVACFLSHCGWNSTLDGLWSGVPFLCWPYYVDQFHNKESICDEWKVGMKLEAGDDDAGLIKRSEIVSKLGEILNDESIKDNASRIRKIVRECVNENGSSFCNFASFVDKLCS